MSGRAATAAAVAIVVVPLLGYPLVTLATGAPRFPRRSDCIRLVEPHRGIAVVYGRFNEGDAASKRLQRVLALGFKGTKLWFDGCGRWVVLLEHVPNATVGKAIVKEAAGVGLHAQLALDPGS